MRISVFSSCLALAHRDPTRPAHPNPKDFTAMENGRALGTRAFRFFSRAHTRDEHSYLFIK